MRHAMMMAALAVLAGCGKAPQGTAGGDAATPVSAPAPSATTPAMPATVVPAAPPASGAALGQSTDAKGEVRMEVTELVRAGGVLTLKTRFTLIAGKPGSRALPGSSTNEVYLTAADKKFLMLKDDGDRALMTSANYPGFDQLGATSAWWAKFPAPPPEVKAVNLFFTSFAPVENVPITDR